MKVKLILKITLSLSLTFTMLITSGIVSNATDLSGETEYESLDTFIIRSEEVKIIGSIEELELDTIKHFEGMTTKKSDSVFKSCRLMISSNEDMSFEDNIFEDKIKSVQKIDDYYIVSYSTPNVTEEAYNFYVNAGYEVEIDEIKDAPEEVSNKDDRDNEVKATDIATTNEDKDTENVDKINENEEDKTIVVAVLDTGLNVGEDIFTERLVEGKNFVECHYSEGMTTKDEEKDKTDDNGRSSLPWSDDNGRSSLPWSDDNGRSSLPWSDDSGHGTTISRVILDVTSDVNDDKQIKILPIKVLNDEGKGTTLSVYKGIKYAIEKKVDVINLSISGIGHSKLLESAIDEAYNNNIPVVVSAGNDNKEITEYTPANIDSAITISATDTSIDENNEAVYTKALYSNFGSETNNIDFTTTGHFSYKRDINNKEVTTSIDGTSVSSAYVTGFIAMLKAMAISDEDDTNNELKFNDYYESLKTSAINLKDTSSFGNGYLMKDNIRLIRSNTSQEKKDIREVINANENIDLTPDRANYAVCISHEYTDFGLLYHIKGGVNDEYGDDLAWQQTPEEAWKSAVYHAGIKGKNNGMEIHIDCDLTINNVNVISDSSKEVWIRSLHGSDKKHSIKLEGSGENPFIKAKEIYVHSLNIYDYRTGKKTVGVLFASSHLEVTDSIIMGNKANAICFNAGKTSHIFDSYIGGQNTCDQALALNDSKSEIRNCDICNCKVGILTNSKSETVLVENRGINYGITNNSQYGIDNAGKFTIDGNVLNNKSYGVYNKGTFKHQGGIIYRNGSTEVYNTGTYSLVGGIVQQESNSGICIDNKKTVQMSSGDVCWGNTGIKNNNNATVTISDVGKIHDNSTGIENYGNIEMNGGYIQSNKGYGVQNESTFNHNGGTISSNNGSAPSNDTTKVGVYQNGTYNIKGAAKVTSNSIYLPNNNKVVNVADDFKNGSAILTTSENDRTIGRELVTNGDKYASKFSLAYGNYNGKTNAYKVKDSCDGASFSGNFTAVRGGSNIKGIKSTSSAYLSGNYSLKYDKNISNPTSPNSYKDTTFYWQEDFKAMFGTNKFTKANDNKYSYEFLGYDLDSIASSPKYKNDTTLNLSKGATYYAIWYKDLLVKDKYYVHYNYNNGYGDEYTQEVYCGVTDNYIKAPARYISANIIYDYAYDNKVGTDKATRNFRGWTKSGTSTPIYLPGSSFIDLTTKDQTVHMWGNWSSNPVTLPSDDRDDYELVGWQDKDGHIYKPGDTYTPTENENENGKTITFTAIWKLRVRFITYNPNGSVDLNGNKYESVTIDAPIPLTTKVTLPNGSTIGGKELSTDTTYTKGYVNNNLVATIPNGSNTHIQQYRAKKGDIINNLGSNNILAKFKGWSKEIRGGNALNGSVSMLDNSLWGNSAYRMNEFVLYAQWDEFPIITSKDIELENISNISQNKLIQGVMATDTEDGNITSKIQIINYNEIVNAFNNGSKEFSIIYEVTDSCGNTTRAFALIKLADTYDGSALLVINKMVRTINRHAYNTHDESLGGCLNGSPWYEDADYVATINTGFDNMDNNTPIAHYMLTKEERVALTDYIHEVGLEHLHDKSMLNYIVSNYMDSTHANKTFSYYDSKGSIGTSIFNVSAETMQKREEQELNRLKALRNNMDLSRIYR